MIELNLKAFFLGVGFALPFAILNSYLVLKAIAPKKGEAPLATYNALLARILLKMGISLLVLVLAGLKGEMVLLGALCGLLMQFVFYHPRVWGLRQERSEQKWQKE